MNKTEVRITGLEANVENVDRISKKNKIGRELNGNNLHRLIYMNVCPPPPLVGLFEKGMGCVLTVGGVSLWLGAEASKAHDILIWLSLIALWLLFQDVISHSRTMQAHRLRDSPPHTL